MILLFTLATATKEANNISAALVNCIPFGLLEVINALTAFTLITIEALYFHFIIFQ